MNNKQQALDRIEKFLTDYKHSIHLIESIASLIILYHLSIYILETQGIITAFYSVLVYIAIILTIKK